MRRLSLLRVVIPVLLGVLVALVFIITRTSNPTLVIKVDLSAIALALILLLVILFAPLMLAVSRIDKLRQNILVVQANSTSHRRRFLQNLKHEILQRYSQRILSNLEDLETACGLNGASDEDCQLAFMALKSQVGYFKQTAGSVQRLSDILNQTQVIAVEELDIVDLLNDVIEQLNDSYEDQHVTLRLGEVAPPLIVKGNWDLLFSAIYNLVDNALKYGGKEGQVLVMAFAAVEGGVTVKIGDHGPGIPAQELDSVWEDFYRSPQTSGQIEGSGLGLPLVRAITERHLGRVDIRSQPGWGTEVSLWLPEPSLTGNTLSFESNLLMSVVLVAAVLAIVAAAGIVVWLAFGS